MVKNDALAWFNKTNETLCKSKAAKYPHNLHSVAHLPLLDAICGSRYECKLSWVPRDCSNRLLVMCQCGHSSASSQVPQLHGMVVRAGYHLRPHTPPCQSRKKINPTQKKESHTCGSTAFVMTDATERKST